MAVGFTPGVTYAVCVHNGTAYPPRPPADVVLFIGPSEPSTWRDHDEWEDKTP